MPRPKGNRAAPSYSSLWGVLSSRYGPYLLVVVLVVGGSILILSRSDDLANRWHTFTVLTCIQKELQRDARLQSSDCIREPEWAALAEQSLTVANLYSQVLLQSNPERLVTLCGSPACGCGWPDDQAQGATLDDPRSKSIAFYGILATYDVSGVLPQLTECESALPSSSHIYVRARRPDSPIAPSFQTAARTIAYELDNEWSRPLWRALSALDQAEYFRETGEPTSARMAYERALASFDSAVTPDKALYLAVTYKGMAELMEDAGMVEEASDYYERSIAFYPQPIGNRESRYVNSLYSADRIDPTGRVVDLVETYGKQNDRLLFDAVSGQIQASQLDAAQAVLDRFEDPMNPYWLAGSGALARARDEYDTAEEFYRLALDMVEEQDPLLAADWHARLAIVVALKGDLGAAITIQKQVTSLAPKNPHYWADLARYYRAQDRIDLAVQAIEEALKLEPSNAQFIELGNELRNR